MVDRLLGSLFIVFYGLLAAVFIYFNLFLISLGIAGQALSDPADIFAIIMLLSGVAICWADKKRLLLKNVINVMKAIFVVFCVPVMGFLIGAIETYQLNI